MFERNSILWSQLRVLLIALCLGSGVAAQDVDVDSLLRVSVGGDAAVERLLNSKGSFTKASGVIGGQPAEMLTIFEKPDKVYLKINLGGLEIVQAYNGEVAWTKDFSGSVNVLGSYEGRQLKNQAYFQSSSFLTDDGSVVKRVYQGLGEIEGKSGMWSPLYFRKAIRY